MSTYKRRQFISKTIAAGVVTLLTSDKVIVAAQGVVSPVRPNNISLAQWALVDEIKSGKWKTLDFPAVARNDFGIDGVELVNTLFEVPHAEYLNRLKQNAADNGVALVLIMVDAEGDPCSPDKKQRRQFAINHRKWVDIAQYLGCHAIRTNCRGNATDNKTEALLWATESYQMLLDYAIPANISILIENHGGHSNDAGWMEQLFTGLPNRYFGSLPDWREPSAEFDNIDYLRRMLPFAQGMSYRNQPDDTQSFAMLRLCQSMGYSGWYGIESSGRLAVQKGIGILRKGLGL